MFILVVSVGALGYRIYVMLCMPPINLSSDGNTVADEPEDEEDWEKPDGTATETATAAARDLELAVVQGQNSPSTAAVEHVADQAAPHAAPAVANDTDETTAHSSQRPSE